MEKDVLGILLAGIIGSILIAGYNTASFGTTRSSAPQQTQESAPVSDGAGTSTADTVDLTDHTLIIYCDAGMAKPSQEITDSLKSATGYEMNVTYVSVGQTQSQITTPKESDMFITGSAKGLKPVESCISESRALIKHIPVLAVQSGNPKNIISLSGLAAEDVSLIAGDVDSTPIGKTAKKILSDVGILDKVQIAVPTAIAPQMAAVTVARGADAAIIWKENCGAEDAKIADSSGLEDHTKAIPVASLTYSADYDAGQASLDHLNSGEAREI